MAEREKALNAKKDAFDTDNAEAEARQKFWKEVARRR